MSQKDYRKFAYHLENLQNTLDRYRLQRGWLVLSWLAWLLLAMILTGFQLNQGFSVIFTGITLLPLIPLLKQSWRHIQSGAALEDEVRRLPYRQLAGEFDNEKPKKHQAVSDADVIEDAPYFTIGDDGELVEVPPEKQQRHS